MKKNSSLLLLWVVLLAGFIFGVAQLFKLRFEAGDVYPPYSSLRADPLGTKALFDSLNRLPGISASRCFDPLEKVGQGAGKTFFYLGLQPEEMISLPKDMIRQWETMAINGGRLVFSFYPVNEQPRSLRRPEMKPKQTPKQDPTADDKTKSAKSPKDKKMPKDDTGARSKPGIEIVKLKERWGVGLAYESLPLNSDGIYDSVRAERSGDGQLPDRVTWHTALHFTGLDNAWRVVYQRGTNPVVVERKFGRGAIVLSADSYFLSNEAMRRDRYPALLAWLAGPGSNVIFDETHLDVSETPGLAALAGKYRLHGLLAGLALLASLFLWKNAIHFLPPYQEDSKNRFSEQVTGKDSASGFVNLLRRSIPPPELLEVCFNEWKKSCAHGRVDLCGKIDQMQAVVNEENARSPRDRSPVDGYQAMSLILNDKFKAQGTGIKTTLYERKY